MEPDGNDNPVIRWLSGARAGDRWWLLLLSFAAVGEILARKFLGHSFQDIDEVSG